MKILVKVMMWVIIFMGIVIINVYFDLPYLVSLITGFILGSVGIKITMEW